MKRKFALICASALLIWLFGRCARMPGSISGGPKDETPPQFLYSVPPIYTTGFDIHAKRISLTFDEFLQLKDVNAQFFSSSPMKKKPEILLYGKTVRVNLKEPLLPDMTYSFSFGEAIADNNEANKITGFLYVFSTGSHIDSLTYTGRVLNAFDLSPRKKDDKVPVTVLLFDDLSDSAVYKTAPVYVTRTDNYGFFTFSHIRADTFRIFALRDMGDNLLFDLPAEQIAFADSLVVTDALRHYHDPQIPFPTSLTLPDTLKEKNPDMVHRDIVLYQFQETPTKQYRTSYERPEANLLRFTYTLPVDSLPMKIIGDTIPVAEKWFEPEFSPGNDTLAYWLTDTTLVNRKTLLLNVLSPRTDSLNQLVYVSDTLKMTFEPPKQIDRRSRRERREDEKSGKDIRQRTAVEMMKITTNIKDKMDLTDRLQLIASQPVRDVDPSKIILTEQVDTLKVPVPFTVAKDSANMRRYYIDWKLKEDAKYAVIVDTMAFSSIYHVYNDSTGFAFTSQKTDYYSSIEITFKNITCPLVVQILKGDKEGIVKQVFLTEGNTVLIDYLKPDKYKLKVIYDKNGNGKWDTGHYANRIQPEKVAYYTEPEIETRSGWKTELQWTLP
ncbi:MAG: Ig-like domain-containing protein [Bacteroidales bacterium]|nr:Ig-like domain-containing protein [Bacteroidales bacterium]